MIFVNMSLINWISKRQPTVETAVFGAEFFSMKDVVETLCGLCYKLRIMGVPIEGPSVGDPPVSGSRWNSDRSWWKSADHERSKVRDTSRDSVPLWTEVFDTPRRDNMPSQQHRNYGIMVT